MTHGRVVLDLHVRLAADGLAAFTAFLRRAVPYYEAPGGIRVLLLRDQSDPSLWIERVEYADAPTYARDQLRVAEDECMKALLAEWRGLLAEPPVVHVYHEVALDPGC